MAPLLLTTTTLNIQEIFWACPVIYTLLLIMSIAACGIWIYSLLTLRQSDLIPKGFIDDVRTSILQKHFEEAIELCKTKDNFTADIIASGLSVRKHGPHIMMETMQAEGRRSSNAIWQKLSLLNEIAVVAPMLGLLGTVLGLFFAFYNPDRTAESITTIFDGLGIAVGTTVAGLIVAILAMVFYTTLKFRVVNLLNHIENESMSLVSIVDMENK